MADMSFFVPGYVYDKSRIDEYFAERNSAGGIVMASQAPGTQGAWQRLKDQGVTRFSLRDAEIPLLGRHRRPYFQKFGTCVSRGTARACQVSLDWAIIKNGALLVPVEVAFAPIYSLARHEVGKDRCGSGDGAIVSDAVSVVHDWGVATTDLFSGISEDDQEKQAVRFASPGVGTPKSWVEACKLHTASTFSPDTLELAFDCIASGYGLVYACNYVTGDTPNKAGLYRLGSQGGHCRAFVGLVVDANGNTQFESNESWSAFPAAQPNQKYSTGPVDDIPCCTFQTSGELITLAPGDCVVDSKQFWSAIQSGGEIWAVGAVSYEGDSISDLTKQAVAS